MPHVAMEHTADAKQKLLNELGDLSGFKLFNNKVLCAIYKRPEKTKGGIILPGQHLDEDRYQSKVGLVGKTGPSAFVDPNGEWFKEGEEVEMHDWIFFRPSDGWSLSVNGIDCRVLDDTNIRGVVSHPDLVW